MADFYDACAPLVERTMEAMVPLLSRVEDEAAGAAFGEIAGIYVVGGASELPVVARMLRQRFGRRVHRSPYPSAAVAIGLSIAADSGAGFELVDRYSRTFGVFRERENGREISFDPIFRPETELPRVRGERLTERRTYRAAHNVGHDDVYFPFDRALREAPDLAGVAVERCNEDGPPVIESYSLDDKGIVEIVIRDLDAGYERTYRLARA